MWQPPTILTPLDCVIYQPTLYNNNQSRNVVKVRKAEKEASATFSDDLVNLNEVYLYTTNPNWPLSESSDKVTSTIDKHDWGLTRILDCN